MSNEVNAVGTAVLLAAAPAGRGRAMDAATVLPVLAAVPAGVLTGTHTATVVELADPLDPQTVLTRLRAAAAAPGPLALCLAGQLQLDRRQRLPHLALARSTPATLRYTGLPWHWLATELAQRRPGTTTVIADLSADPELWERLRGAGPGPLELAPAVGLFARITPFPRRGALNTPDYLRHFASVWRSGARPALAALHEEAGAVARAAGQEEALLLSVGDGSADTPLSAATGPGAMAVPRQQAVQQAGQQEGEEAGHAEPAHARAQESAPGAYGASRPPADPPSSPRASTPAPAPAVVPPVPPRVSTPVPAPAAVPPVPPRVSTPVPAPATMPPVPPGVSTPAPAPATMPPVPPRAGTPAVVPPRPAQAPEVPAGYGSPGPGRDMDPHPAILAAAMAGRHGEAAAMAAAWESEALRRHGPRSAEALHWVEVRADLARLAGEPARSCELWIAAAQARLGLRQEPDEPDVEGAVDRAHHQWEQIKDPARARALGPALVELRRRVPGRHAGALAALQRRMGA
ncbi:hypothetical protein [Streptomyces sp. NPDC003943]